MAQQIQAQQQKVDILAIFTHLWRSLVSWSWTKSLLYWIVLSAGTGSELAFLAASLWVTINASVHKFVLLFLPEQTTVWLSDLATVAYVGLPECILALAIVTTFSHIKTFLYSKKQDKISLAWSVLYGLPTAIFFGISMWTIGCSLLSINFQLPAFMIVARGLSGYFYGLIALLYWFLGKPVEADRLAKKDAEFAEYQEKMAQEIAALLQEKDAHMAAVQSDNSRLQSSIARLTDEVNASREQADNHQHHNQQLQAKNAELLIAIARLETLVDTLQQQSQQSTKKAKKTEANPPDNREVIPENTFSYDALSEEDKRLVMQYPIVLSWLSTGVSTVTIPEIISGTGHSAQLVRAREREGVFHGTVRKGSYRVSSVIAWLRTEKLPKAKEGKNGGDNASNNKTNEPSNSGQSTIIETVKSMQEFVVETDEVATVKPTNGQANGHKKG